MSNSLKWELHCSNTKLVARPVDGFSYHLHTPFISSEWHVNVFHPNGRQQTLVGNNMFEAMQKSQIHYDLHREELRSNEIASQEQPLLQGCIAQVVSS